VFPFPAAERPRVYFPMMDPSSLIRTPILSGFLRLLALLLLLSSSAGAQTVVATDASSTPTLAIRIGFVDMDFVLQDSRVVWEALREVDADMERRERELLAKKRDLRGLELRMEQQGGVLSAAERRRREQEIIDLVNEIDEMEYRFTRHVREKEARIVGPLQRLVLDLVGETARKEGFDLVLRGEMVLYGTPATDLTGAVLRLLESRPEAVNAIISPPPGGENASLPEDSTPPEP
jgi:outer membrane protein